METGRDNIIYSYLEEANNIILLIYLFCTFVEHEKWEK